MIAVEALGASALAVEHHLTALVQDGVASRLATGAPAAWALMPRVSRPLVGEVEALRAHLRARGVEQVALVGTSGPVLAAAVVCASSGVPLTVLDPVDPDAVASLLSGDLGATVVVVAAPPGAPAEVRALLALTLSACVDAGLRPDEHVVVVAAPGTDTAQVAGAGGAHVVTADPRVDGGWAALSAYALVPSGLAGADISSVLEEAEEMQDLLAEDDPANPGLRLGAALAGTVPLRDKVLLTDQGCGHPGLATWVAQLFAEGTGGSGAGLLPVPAGTDEEPGAAMALTEDLQVLALVADPLEDEAVVEPTPEGDSVGARVNVSGSLGGQLLLWHCATAVAAHLLGTDPRVAPAAEDAPPDPVVPSAPWSPLLVDGAVQVGGGGAWTATAPDSLAAAVDAWLALVEEATGHVRVTAYLDPASHGDLADLREVLTERSARPVVFGWGPRAVHATRSSSRPPHPGGVHLHLSADVGHDLPVPGDRMSLGELLAARVRTETQALLDHDHPVLHLHLTDRPRGLQQVRRTLEGS